MIKTEVKNAFFNAVTSYNDTVTNPKKSHFNRFTPDELKGIFYNCLRRENLKIRDKRKWSDDNLKIDDFIVTFDNKLRITSFKIITKKVGWGWVDSWSEYALPSSSDVDELRKLDKEYPVIYPNRSLNEMVNLINQIKT